MKTLNKIHRQAGFFLAAILSFGCLENLLASPASDLASPSQAVRDAAAKILRETYVPPPRTNWDSLVGKLKLGISKLSALEALGEITNNVSGSVGSSSTEMNRYRLDDLWLMECSYTGRGTNSVLTHLNFIQGLRFVSVEPPLGFSGRWTTYYVNGQKFSEGVCKNGMADGEGFGFYPDGSKMVVNHSLNGMLNGEETGFYPNGHIRSKGFYKDNTQVGTWTWYNEDGTVHSKRNYSKP